MSGLMEQPAAKKTPAETAEAPRSEKEAKRDALGEERKVLIADIARTEQGAQEADAALTEIANMQGQEGGLDPETAAMLGAGKEDAVATKREFEARKARLAEIDLELAALEGGGAAATAAVEAKIEKPLETFTDQIPAAVSGNTEQQLDVKQSEEQENQKSPEEKKFDDALTKYMEVVKQMRQLSKKGDFMKNYNEVI